MMTFAPRAEDAGRTLLSTYSSRDETKTMRCTPSDKQVCNSSCVYLLHRDKKRRTVFPAGCSSIPTLTAAGAVTAINYFLSSCPLVSTLPHHPCTQILQRSTSSFRDGISGGGTTTKVLAGETLGTAPLSVGACSASSPIRPCALTVPRPPFWRCANPLPTMPHRWPYRPPPAWPS